MQIQEQIKNYINSLTKSKANEIQELHNCVLEINPTSKLWFLDGKNEDGKVVSNPNIGYGIQTTRYADGKTKEFYQVGISANTTGISLYIMGVDDKTYLQKTFGEKLVKATVTGYCIKFKTLQDINMDALKEVIQFGFEIKSNFR